ncbi:MAG: Asp23/Gls24 family envelope stress response protein [Ruminococcus sp.]|nr:Asp23/Gls24 family envelope stress response protein [Ruminococcus sp.]
MLVIENYMGKIAVSEKYLHDLCSAVLSNTFGVAGLITAGKKWALHNLFSSEDRNAARSITIKTIDGKLFIGVHILVLYGTKISAVTDSVINKLKYNIEENTGLKVAKITVYVDGITA